MQLKNGPRRSTTPQRKVKTQLTLCSGESAPHFQHSELYLQLELFYLQLSFPCLQSSQALVRGTFPLYVRKL